MPAPMTIVGSRYQKASPSQKIYRVIAVTLPHGQPAHVHLSSEADPTEVITVAVSALGDLQFWKFIG